METAVTFGQVQYDDEEQDEDMELPEELKGSIPQGPVNPFEQVPQKPTRPAFVVDANALAGKLEQERREKDLLAEEEEEELESDEEGSYSDQSDVSMEPIPPNLHEEHVRKERKVFWTSDPQSPFDLDIGEAGLSSEEPTTIPKFFKDIVKEHPKAVALKWKEGDKTIKLTFEEYWDRVVAVGRSFIKHGIYRFCRVCIIGNTCPQWYCTALGAILTGGMVMGISPTATSEECLSIMSSCGTSICVVQDMEQFEKVFELWPQMPHLNCIVIWNEKLPEPLNRVYKWEEFLAKGVSIGYDAIDVEMFKQDPAHTAILATTNGSTGLVKKVMLTHDNIVWTTKALYSSYKNGLHRGKETFLSLQPPCHITNMLMEIFLPIRLHSSVTFAPLSEEDSVLATLKETQPTVVFGAPNIWERLMVETRPNDKKKTITKKMLGLSHCHLAAVGCSRVPEEVTNYFGGSRLHLKELYGSAETTGIAALNTLESVLSKTGTQGWLLEGTQLNIENTDTVGNGQVMVKGRNVFCGYLGQKDLSEKAINSMGWLDTGDIGKKDSDGFLCLLARTEELIKTMSGEYVLAGPIEAIVKGYVPFLGHVMIIGHSRRYITCLLSLKCALDPETGEATDDLTPDAAEVIRTVYGRGYTKASEILESDDEAISKATVYGITQYNQKHASSYNQKILKFHLLDTDFTVAAGELTPDGQMNRQFILDKYEDEIEDMYEE